MNIESVVDRRINKEYKASLNIRDILEILGVEPPGDLNVPIRCVVSPYQSSTSHYEYLIDNGNKLLGITIKWSEPIGLDNREETNE